MANYRRQPKTREPVEQTRSIEPGTVTSIEPQKHSTVRYSIFLDGEFAFGVGRDLLLSSGLARGEFLDRARIDAILARDAIERAVSAAMRALDQRLQSRSELRIRLLRKGFSPETTDAALNTLAEHGYLDDGRFAEVWIENRLEHRPRGKRMLEAELRKKGIDRQTVDATMAEMPIDDRDAAIVLARKGLKRVEGLPRDEQARKLTGMLARRGFDYGVIRDTLKSLVDADPDELAMGESADDVV